MKADTVVSFIVPGTPQGKGRPRFNRSTGAAYTPATTATYENFVKVLAMKAMEGRPPEQGAVRVEIGCYFAMPKSTSQKRVQQWLTRTNPWPSVKKPDLDNIQKAVTDGMNGVVYLDDVQVVAVHAFKVLVAPDIQEHVEIQVTLF